MFIGITEVKWKVVHKNALTENHGKEKKYDGILSFSRQFEFIYVETATTSIPSKTENDLSKLHQAIVLMFKLMVPYSGKNIGRDIIHACPLYTILW